MKVYLAAIVIIVIELALILSYDFDRYSACYSSECIEFFLDEFSLAIQFPVAALSIAVAVAALIKLSVAQKTYINQANSSKIANNLNHLDHFTNIVSFNVKRLERIQDVPISYPLLHAAFFPDMSLSGERPAQALKRWSEFVSETSEMVEKEGTRALVPTNYRRELEPLMRSVGISIDSDVNDRVFFSMEQECYELLQDINKISEGRPANEFQTPSYLVTLTGS